MYATTASKSACPGPDDYMKSFGGANNIVVVTWNHGSYCSAVAKRKFIWKSILILRLRD